jgi:PilZ domain
LRPKKAKGNRKLDRQWDKPGARRPAYAPHLNPNHASDGDEGRGHTRLGACGRKIETMNNPKQERRNEARRRRVLKKARITFKDRCATIDCTVRNLSDRGACLNVESYIGIPDSFDLVLDNAPVRGCRVTWRNATQIGVEFA